MGSPWVDRCLNTKSLSTGFYGALWRDERVIARPIRLSGPHTPGIMERSAGKELTWPFPAFSSQESVSGLELARSPPSGILQELRELASRRKIDRFRFLTGNAIRTRRSHKGRRSSQAMPAAAAPDVTYSAVAGSLR